MKRQQHQAETDRDSAHVLDPGLRTAAKRHQAENEQHWGGRGDVEGQDLNDQRGPEVRAEHDRKRRDQTDQTFRRERTCDQGGGGAALQQRGQPDAGRKSRKPVPQAFGEAPAEIGTERAQHAAVDHMQAP